MWVRFFFTQNVAMEKKRDTSFYSKYYKTITKTLIKQKEEMAKLYKNRKRGLETKKKM